MYFGDDAAAAARYTECRLDPIALDLLAGIDEDTVDFTENYSGEFTEPVVLPARFPNLLVNGSQGIAVGMATNIPPHNLGEVIDACVHLIKNRNATVAQLMKFINLPKDTKYITAISFNTKRNILSIGVKNLDFSEYDY